MKQQSDMMQIAHRLGLYDPSILDMDAPVYADADAMVRAYREANA